MLGTDKHFGVISLPRNLRAPAAHVAPAGQGWPQPQCPAATSGTVGACYIGPNWIGTQVPYNDPRVVQARAAIASGNTGGTGLSGTDAADKSAINAKIDQTQGISPAGRDALHQVNNGSTSQETINGLIGLGTAGLQLTGTTLVAAINANGANYRAQLDAETRRYMADHGLTVGDTSTAQGAAANALLLQMQIAAMQQNRGPNWQLIGGVGLAVVAVGAVGYVLWKKPRHNPVVVRHGRKHYERPSRRRARAR